MGAGTCDVIAEDRDNASVSVTPHRNDERSREAAEATKVDFRDNKLTIRSPEGMAGWLRGRSSAIDVTVKIPLGSSVNAKTASAPIGLHGELEVVSATTASGEITVEKTAQATVNTASGDAHVIECSGEARGNTVSGDLLIDHAGGDVNAKSVSGDVRIGYAGRSVQGNSVSGDLTVSTVHSGVCKLRSVSGTVSVGVAPGVGVWMDLNSISGTTSSDLAVGDMPSTAAASLQLHVNTVSGNIDLFRSQPTS
ncbi:MAG TPA: DUF4097 family beta strand repeat-containing protein [Stackebrandtia sp.]|jgi:DUF4097 and DUF4098 domain-containing protein YvlB|uniref:DUF4097 family beta strand repeat-containing protein n=1 Tax=Stackebrandtia sp. TaxID=2023065 RepID=UPI002D3E3619|nr:DUF4097 family beta strand repeat-containing protein [Stackebrandtia sp.]HZE38355.1 DUF4097 family beta strand repeat-containing protein [Stackebrandtia sp.]